MNWLTDVKQGKYEGLQQAGFLYAYGKQYKEYVQLTIYELIDKLNHNDFKIRKNAYWMISKISEQFNHHYYLIPVIPILNFGLKDKSPEIVRYSLTTLLNLSTTMVKRINYLYNDILQNLANYEEQEQVFAIKLITKLFKPGNPIPSDDYLLKNLGNKKISAELVSLLVYKNSYKPILPDLLANLQFERQQDIIFRFIEEACQKYPFKIILALKKTLNTFDPLIRQNSLLIFQKIKTNPKIYIVIPQILKLIGSKIRTINRISLYFLYDIHLQILKELRFYINDLYRLRNKGDLVVKIVINSILIDLARYDYQIIGKIQKKVIKQLNKGKDLNDVRINTISVLSLSTISLWSDSEQSGFDLTTSIKKAINLIETVIQKYPIEDYAHEVYSRLGLLYLYSKEYEKAKKCLERALTFKSIPIISLYSNLYLILINFLIRLPKTATDLLEHAKKEYLTNPNISRSTKSQIKLWNSIFDSIFHFDIKRASEQFDELLLKDKLNNKWELNLQNLIKSALSELKPD